MNRVVYGLTHEDGKVFYVGKTSQPAIRLSSHKCKFGHDIKMVILQDTFEEETIDSAEVRWIEKLKDSGIVNISTCESAPSPLNPKSGSIMIRVRSEEKAALMEGAATDDRPLSDWLRTLGRKRLKELDLPLLKKSESKSKKGKKE